MAWAKLDDAMTFHAKIVESGNAACGVWFRLIAWSAQHLTDGHVPDKIARLVAGESRGALASLERTGLLLRCPGGYTIHDYLEYNPSRAEVLEKREKERLRKGGNSARNPPGRDAASASPVPSRPDPTRPDPGDDVIGGTVNLDFFATAIANAGITISLTRIDQERFSRLHPVQGWEVDDALGKLDGRKIKRAGYILTMLETGREEMADLKVSPKPPAAGRRRGRQTPEEAGAIALKRHMEKMEDDNAEG